MFFFFFLQTPLSFSQPTFDVVLAPTTMAPEQNVMFSSFESFSSQCKTPWATMPARHVYISKQQTSFGPFYALTSDFCSLFPLTSVAQWQRRRCGETVPLAPVLLSPGGAEENTAPNNSGSDGLLNGLSDTTGHSAHRESRC